MRADDNFLPKDASNIVAATLRNCRKLLGEAQTRGRGISQAAAWMPTLADDLMALGLPPEMDLDKTMAQYAEQLVQARRTLKAVGIL